MPCYHPRDVWRSPRHLSKSGKPRIFFSKPSLFYASPRHIEFYAPEQFQIPACKPKCVGCIESYSRSWAVRCWHESLKHDQNCFITLTFNDQFLPKNGLDHRYFQLFMKRLRRYLDSAGAGRLSYFMCGEYGEKNFRPHFHACFFGFDFPDRVLFSVRDGVRLDTSDILSSLWSDPVSKESYGFSSVGDVTFESAAYVARYVAKKVSKAEADSHYQGRKPEYARMSLRPAIAKRWIASYRDSVYPSDAVVLPGGAKVKPPRYYDKSLELTDPAMSSTVKSNRQDRARQSPDNTPERLAVREKVKQAQFKMLMRKI